MSQSHQGAYSGAYLSFTCPSNHLNPSTFLTQAWMRIRNSFLTAPWASRATTTSTSRRTRRAAARTAGTRASASETGTDAPLISHSRSHTLVEKKALAFNAPVGVKNRLLGNLSYSMEEPSCAAPRSGEEWRSHSESWVIALGSFTPPIRSV